MAARPSEPDKKVRIFGERLAKSWGLDVRDARYRETGDWYHGLRNFPAAFLDAGGYVEFHTYAEYQQCSALRIGPKGDVGVPDGIKAIPGYRQRPDNTASEKNGAGGGAPDTVDASGITAVNLPKTSRVTVTGSRSNSATDVRRGAVLATPNGPPVDRIPRTRRLKLPSEYAARMRGIVATSIGIIRGLRPDWYFAKMDRSTHLRIYFGHLIVVTLEGPYVWAAISEAVLGARDRLLKSWVWDEPGLRPTTGGNAHPRYSSPDSRNGFYDPARDADGAEWSFIEVAHHAYLREAATGGRAPDNRTMSDPGLVDELDSWQPYGMNDVALEHAVRQSLSDTKARRARLASAPKKPTARPTLAVIFIRNADVIAEVLHRSKGHCESCRNPAPFVRASDGTPYLEVHHRVRLADGGDDTVENAIALCPNCHRRDHYG